MQRGCRRTLIVVQGETVDHVGARLVDTDHFDPLADFTEFQDDLIQRADRRNIPQMRLRDINRHRLHLFGKIKGGDEALRRSEENLTVDAVDPLPAIG